MPKKPSGRTLTGSRVEAQRRLRRARIDALMAGRRPRTGRVTTPLTPQQIRSQEAARRRRKFTKGTAIERLEEALRGKVE